MTDDALHLAVSPRSLLTGCRPWVTVFGPAAHVLHWLGCLHLLRVGSGARAPPLAPSCRPGGTEDPAGSRDGVFFPLTLTLIIERSHRKRGNGNSAIWGGITGLAVAAGPVVGGAVVRVFTTALESSGSTCPIASL